MSGAGCAAANGYYRVDLDPAHAGHAAGRQQAYTQISREGAPAVVRLAVADGGAGLEGHVRIHFLPELDAAGREVPAGGGAWSIMHCSSSSSSSNHPQHTAHLYWQLGNRLAGFRLQTLDDAEHDYDHDPENTFVTWRVGQLPGNSGRTHTTDAVRPNVELFYPSVLE